jgi:hypothetical protein|tara:strand:- start:164 stop:502 length:339 start_codon:yes stop_codon:yes gene_type:complete
MKYSLSLLFSLILVVFSSAILADTDEIVCLKTDKIRSVDFKKDFMVFEMQKRQKYNVTCKGPGNLNFENPVIIEPQKMGNKICSNDVLKLRYKTCFIDKIVLNEVIDKQSEG